MVCACHAFNLVPRSVLVADLLLGPRLRKQAFQHEVESYKFIVLDS